MPALLILLFIMTALIPAQSQIILAPGEKTLIKAASSEIKVESTKVLKLEVATGGVRVTALRPGTAHLQIRNTPEKIIVLPHADYQLWIQLKGLTKNMVGIELAFSKETILLRGTLYSFKDWRQIQRLLESSAATVENHLMPLESVRKEVLQTFAKELKKQGLPAQKVAFTKPWMVRVPPKSERLVDLKKYFALRGVLVETQEGVLDLKPVIKVDIAVTEVKIDSMKKIGLQWPTTYTARVIDAAEISFDELVFSAHALEGKGFGKILARPNLLSRSGSEAEFLAGGEFPIKIKNFGSQNVVWKKYGILLKISPLADEAGRISLKISTEISNIDMSKAVDGVPGLLTNSVSSHFDLLESQTVALSGLLRLDRQEKKEGLAWLSQVPLLGNLFSSKDYIENRSELVIFVRPQVLTSFTEDQGDFL